MRALLLLLFGLLLPGLPVLAYEGDDGIRFRDPGKWEKKLGVEGSQVLYYAPKAPGPRATLGYTTSELGEVESLQREEVLAVTRRLAREVEEYKMVGSKAVKYGGIEGHLVSYRGKKKKTQLQSTQVFLVYGGKLHLFTLVSSPSQHAKFRKTLDGVLSSLEFAP